MKRSKLQKLAYHRFSAMCKLRGMLSDLQYMRTGNVYIDSIDVQVLKLLEREVYQLYTTLEREYEQRKALLNLQGEETSYEGPY